jgi:glycosyltransferase involved in cell wall biosynthesis
MVGGNPQGLARAERELGLESWSVAFLQTCFGYQTDELLVRNSNHPILLEIKRWALLWRALRDFDIVHFNFGQTILPSLLAGEGSVGRRYAVCLRRLYHLYASLLNMTDLNLLQRAGKGIVVTFQGNDARQGDYSLENFKISIAQNVAQTYYTAQSDALKRRIISKFARYADRIFYLNPDLAYLLPPQAAFLPYGHIDLRVWRPSPVMKPVPERPTLVHAPSHRAAKGTSHVLEAVKRLQHEGVAFDFILVEGVPQSEARLLYERADILVEQFLVGWYGGLAVELMALGKPVICYIREGDLKFIPTHMRKELPIVNSTPTTLYPVLKELLTVRKHEIPEIGRRSRAYVERWHDPLRIAARLRDEYQAIIESKRQRGRR